MHVNSSGKSMAGAVQMRCTAHWPRLALCSICFKYPAESCDTPSCSLGRLLPCGKRSAKYSAQVVLYHVNSQIRGYRSSCAATLHVCTYYTLYVRRSVKARAPNNKSTAMLTETDKTSSVGLTISLAYLPPFLLSLLLCKLTRTTHGDQIYPAVHSINT